ncbi:ATP-binding cassette domain-containing protein [Marinomonas sp.]|nr:ATP-binding cassette domain-containing protein [Marinomonas sp.]MDB4836955.1 ATP-binding cassette domain-containing protein [Marinomonas sp.]
MIELNKVQHSITSTNILQETNLTLVGNQIIALIGPNGAGKSTLLSLMSRLLPLQSGSILFDGMDISTARSDEVARKIAILQQSTHFMSRLKVEDLLIFSRYPYHKGRPTTQDKNKVEEIIQYFGLESLKSKFIDQLSGGQRQIALVAMTFCQDTDYILLDEPLNNLDMYHARYLMKTLKQAISDWGKTIVVVMHDINYASCYADYIVALQQGRILFHGQVSDVLTEENIEQLYKMKVSTLDVNNKRFFAHF